MRKPKILAGFLAFALTFSSLTPTNMTNAENLYNSTTSEVTVNKTEDTTENNQIETQILTEDELKALLNEQNDGKPTSTFLGENDLDDSLFTTQELLIGTNDPSIFTWDTEVLSEYNGVYLVRFNSVLETKNAYQYYQDKADYVSPNIVFNVADTDSADIVDEKTDTEEIKNENLDETNTEDNTENTVLDETNTEDTNLDESNTETTDLEENTTENTNIDDTNIEKSEDVEDNSENGADLSNLNQGDDAIATLNDLTEDIDETVNEDEKIKDKIIALIDTGVQATDLVDSIYNESLSREDKMMGYVNKVTLRFRTYVNYVQNKILK